MRLVDLLEGDVVPFRRPAPSAGGEQNMADPIDLDAARNQKIASDPALKNTIDKTKFDSAVRKQQGGPKTVSDLARDIVARNWDNIINQKPLPPEDKHTLDIIIKSSHYFQFQNAEMAISAAQRKANVPFNKMVVILNPSSKDAYLHDDPSHKTYRIKIGRDVTAYPSQRERDIAAMGMLDPNIFDPAEHQKIMALLNGDPSHDSEMAFNDTFDPNTNEREYSTQMLPRFERMEKQLDKIARQNDKNFFLLPKQFIDPQTQQDSTKWELSIYDQAPDDEGQYAMEMLRQEFGNVEDLEQWLETHFTELQKLLTTRIPRSSI